MLDRRLYPAAALHGQVAHDIGRRIVSGGIREGETLPREAELSRQFSVSRQAVREALKVLAAKGLVSSRRRAGTHVVPRASWNLLDPDVLAWHKSDALPADFVQDLVELRRLIEPAAAEHAARRGDSKKLAEIGAALAAMRSAVDDRDRFFDADVEFHVAIFTASGNTLIERLGTIVGPLLEASFRVQRQTAGDPEGLIHTHNDVFDAIVDGDAPRARQAMEVLLNDASEKASRLETAPS
jgi:GntR family galactonate operon transcriptional repressor